MLTAKAIPMLIPCLLAAANLRAQAPVRFTLSSPDVHAGGQIPNQYVFSGMGCTGNNTSPPLRWHGAPRGTKSFALTIYDPDAPTGSGWWHWVIYNIPGSTTSLAAGAGDPAKALAPVGSVQGHTDFGMPGYGGPCPPKGDKPHRYIFTAYALDIDKLDLPSTATAAYVGFNLHAHTMGKAIMTAVYSR